ncbi:alcohol dehydrogenase [Spiroplasma clarkii]|nr:alcohol dehydrogenase catalytic domain-containing protein [Spiroplasma clarkii]ARU91698.1 alcohol dehydrogenase [Spiroplasma clarkii]
MKVAICEKLGEKLTIKELPTPKVGDNDCLVKIKASGVCHTDLHAVTGDWPIKPVLPLVPGHEGVGEVIEVGKNVDFLKVGDRVGVPWLYSACGRCEWCVGGRETICPFAQYSGYTKNGGYATHCLADAKYVCKIPENLSYEAAAPIFCAGVTTYKALKQTKVIPGGWVGIFGIGGLGHLAVQYAIAMGMKVVVIDIDDKKLALAKKYGASLLINGAKEPTSEIINKKLVV